MATIIISSKSLKRRLDQLDFNEEWVKRVRMFNDEIAVYTNLGVLDITCVCNQTGFSFAQDEVRWDWLHEIVGKISEIPLVINIEENKLRLSIDL